MNTFQLKKDLHSLIDSIENENLLYYFYNILKTRVTAKDGKLWENLTKKQQEELLLAFEESKDNNNLSSNEDIKKKYKKWL